MEIFQELVPANGIPTADGASKVAGARVSAKIGFWEEQQVDVSSEGMVGCGGEGGEGLGSSRKGAGLCGCDVNFGHFVWFPLGLGVWF